MRRKRLSEKEKKKKFRSLCSSEACSLGDFRNIKPCRGERERIPERVENAVGEHSVEAVPPETVESGRGAQAEVVGVFFLKRVS